MKLIWVMGLILLPVAAMATPVQIVLQANSTVQANSQGFFTMDAVASLTGGSPALRADLGAIPVGRAPLPGDVRELTPGDLVLKLRQAGYQPGSDGVVSGVPQANVILAAGSAAPAPAASGSTVVPAGSPPAAPLAPAVVIHSGDPVTIHIEDAGIRISALGTAQSTGSVGDTIRVYRPNCPTALVATVLDSQNVLMEP